MALGLLLELLLWVVIIALQRILVASATEIATWMMTVKETLSVKNETPMKQSRAAVEVKIVARARIIVSFLTHHLEGRRHHFLTPIVALQVLLATSVLGTVIKTQTAQEILSVQIVTVAKLCQAA